MHETKARGPKGAGRVRLQALTMADEHLVDDMFDRLTAYSMLAEGQPRVPGAAGGIHCTASSGRAGSPWATRSAK